MPSLSDLVREHAPAYLRRFGDAVPKRHVRALEAITDCRTAALGAELAHCDRCDTTHLLFHSCRHRACPRCGFEATRRWIERQHDALLPVPYFHVVFTLPAQLRRLVRDHQQVLLDVLFRAAFDSLQSLAADPKYLGARIGAVAVLHTWTRSLEWHPHVHLLVPGGGLANDGRTFVSARKPGRADFLVPISALGALFRGRFLSMAHRALPGIAFPKLPDRKAWIVFAKRSVAAKPDRLIEYLGRYLHRTALTDKRITASDERSVTFTYRDSRTGKRKSLTLTTFEFLRRFLQHVPLPGFHRVRAYGLLHGHQRTTLKRLQLLLDAVPPKTTANDTPEETPAQPSPPARPYSPVPCPTCRQPALRIIARLTAAQARDYHELTLLAAHPRAPP